MAARRLRVSLRGWATGRIIGEEFFTLLGVQPDDGVSVRAGERRGQSALVTLVDEELAEYGLEPEPWKPFERAITNALLKAAKWLRGRPEGALQACRRRGIKTDMLIGSWIDRNEADLSLPAPFLLECGRLGVGITLVTSG